MKTPNRLFIILALLLTQCSSKIEKNSFFENFRMTGVTIVNKQDFTDAPINSIHYRAEKNDTIFSFYNNSLKSIIFIGLGKSNFRDTVPLHNIFSEYNVESYIEYLYVDDNKLFIITGKMNDDFYRKDYFVFNIDMNGNILETWDIAQITGINETYFLLKAPFVYQNEKLIIMANILHHPTEEKDVSKTPTELIINTQTNEAHFVYGKPEIYGNGKYYGNHTHNHSKVFINDTVFVLSFPIDHSIYKFHVNGELIEKKQCKSDFINEFKSFEWSENMSFEKIIEIQATQAYYSQLAYDSQNNLIFRLVLHGQNALTESGEKASFFDRSFSLMVIDKNLQIVGEYFIPPFHLYPWMINTNLSGVPFFGIANLNPSLLCIAQYEFLSLKQKLK